MLYFWQCTELHFQAPAFHFHVPRDDRDGPDFCGWWFGPKVPAFLLLLAASRRALRSGQVGGDQVWAYHSEKAPTPPLSGWKARPTASCRLPESPPLREVPYDGPVDNTFILQPASGHGSTCQISQSVEVWGSLRLS